MRYSARDTALDGHRIIQLEDTETDTRVSISPEFGNNAFEFRHRGHNYLWQPTDGFQAFYGKRALFGVPFLSPWANRLDQDSYWVNDAQFTVNRNLGNIRDDQNHKPIHGLMIYQSWQVDRLSADTTAACSRCSFRFSGKPHLMAQFPFAHRLEMTHMLRDGRLHVRLRLENECEEMLPVAIGFHPYYTLPGSREGWAVQIPATKHVELSAANIPTGGYTANPYSGYTPMRAAQFDDVFTDLTRGPEGWAVFRVRNSSASLSVGFGQKYPVGIVYSPKGSSFICFEPMAALTNAFNLAHAGFDSELQNVEPGNAWEEEFWIQPGMPA